MNLYEGIFERKSVRSFLMEPIDPKLIEHIRNFAEHLEMLSPNQKVRYEIVSGVDKKIGLAKTMQDGKAPYYFLLYGKKTEGYLLNAGFLLEQIVLYMTTKKLGTCYLGMKSFKSQDEMEPIIAVAFGKPKKDTDRGKGRHKRKPLDSLCCFKAEVSAEMREIVNAARLAPSSINGQPWRFVVYENRIHLFCRKGSLLPKAVKRLHGVDMGIALAHLLVAGEEFWYSPEIKKLPNILEQKLKQNEYVITIKFTKQA